MAVEIRTEELTGDVIERRVDELLQSGLGYEEYRDGYVNFCKWFSGKEQKLWLYALKNYNWDNEILPLYFMVERKECDLSVAKSIFWLSEFDYFWCDEKNWINPRFAAATKSMLELIVEREDQFGFVRSQLGPVHCRYLRDMRKDVEQVSKRLIAIAPKIPTSLLNVEDFSPTGCYDEERFQEYASEDTSSFQSLGCWPSSAH